MIVPGQHPEAHSASPAPASSPAQPGWAIWATVLFVSQRPRWQRLGLTFLIVVTAVGLRVAFLGGLGRGTAYITFYPAVMLAALCGGWAAGVLASTLCTLLAYAWIQQHQLNPTEWLALVIFVLSSALVSGLSELLHRAVRRLRAEVDQHTRAEAARRESEARYHAVLENLEDAVLLTQPDGSVLSANPAACHLFGRTAEEICRIGRYGLVDTSDPRLAPLLARRTETGRTRGELAFLRADGSRFEGECASSLFTDATGRTCTSMVIRDLTAQQLAAARLERAAHEWQTTFDATRDAVWVLDRDSRILRANRTAEQRFGCPAAAMIGRPCWEIAHGTTAPILECPLARAASSLQRATAELPRGDRWWEIIVDPILDEAGRFAGAVHSVSDITERKRAELHLEERNALLDALINSPEDIVIFSLDRNYCYTAFNEKHRQEMRKVWAAEIRLGASLLDTMGATPLRALAKRSIDRALGGETFTEIQHQPGPDIHYEFVWNPIRQKDGGVSGVTAFIRDITERKRAEIALAESEARFSATFEQASVGIAQVGLDGRWLRVNQRLCDIVGYAREELFARTFQDITHPDDLEADLGLVRKVLAGELRTYAMEKRYIRKDRSVVPVNLTVSLVREASGEPKYFISVVEDIAGRKRAEEARVRLLHILESSLNEIYVFDVESLRFEYANQGALHNLGYSLEALRTMTPLDLKPEFTEDSFRQTIAPLLRHKEGKIVFTTIHRRADGSTYPVEAHLQRVELPGQPVFLAVILDITERTRAEQALHESERFARSTIDALSAHLCVLDDTGAILATNQSWRQFAEANPPAPTNAQTGANYLAICDAATGPEAADARAFAFGIRSVMSGELPLFALEYPCHSPTEQRWFMGRVTRFADTGTVRLVVVHENITQRKHAESALLAAHANLERLVAERTAALSETNRLLAQTSHLAQVGGWEVDLRCGTNSWSGATREIHEVAEDFVPNVETALSFYAPEARATIAAAVQLTSTTGEPFDLELPFITAKGTRLWVRATGQAVREQDRIVKIRGVFQDITERRRAEDELRTHRDQLELLLAELTAANERLRELDRLKSEFLSTMSHELRTPLNSIVGFTGILLKELSGPLNPEQNKQLGLVQSSARHLLALINDLLDLSRIESGRIELQREPFDFAGVVAEVTSFLTPIAQQKALALHADCAPAALPLVGDRRRSLQILLNLATNAVKFTERGEVAISARLADGWLVVAVRDTGIGIRPDQLPLLFEAFRQLDASARRHYEGTGLGLHLCKKLLGLLGGTITVESTAGVGSTFTFTLPLALAPPGGAGFTPAIPSSVAPP